MHILLEMLGEFCFIFNGSGIEWFCLLFFKLGSWFIALCLMIGFLG